jgi:CHAT domain-containing protein
MVNRLRVPVKLLLVSFIWGVLFVSLSFGVNPSRLNSDYHKSVNQKKWPDISFEIKKLDSTLIAHIQEKDTSGSRILFEKLLRKINNTEIDTLILSDSYYAIGLYYNFISKLEPAISYLKLATDLRERIGVYDTRYVRSLYNMGVFYYSLGNFRKHENYSTLALNEAKKLYGNTSPELVYIYISLVSSSLQLQEYDKALFYSEAALAICKSSPQSVSATDQASLYGNFGSYYFSKGDYTKAKIFFGKAESFYKTSLSSLSDNYINLLNNLAITYGMLEFHEKEDEYYEKGIVISLNIKSSLAYVLISNYANVLGDNGNSKKGESLLFEVLGRATPKEGEVSRDYFELLDFYANYLREYKISTESSLKYYKKCMEYLDNNRQDNALKNRVSIGYSLSLLLAGEPDKALEIIQSLLFSDSKADKKINIYENPPIETIKPDRVSIKILKTKHKILKAIYQKSQVVETLQAAAGTSELLISVIEKMRINISEEDSRLILGDRNRDCYLDAIDDFNLLYSKTDEKIYIEKAFEYSEKSKVAGLLSSTREIKASQLHIPPEISDLEKALQNDIRLLNARLTEEILKERPDTTLMSRWNDNLLTSTRLRDSLILVFEKKFPDYFTIKYNTKVASIADIPKIVGSSGNYINYILSDSLLYVFVVNKKNQHLLTLPVDSSVLNRDIRQFRSLISRPSLSDDARAEFKEFQSIGYDLYKILIDPVKPYLISDKIIISPDNILSYIPFETIPTSAASGDKIMYNTMKYLMDDFDISYTYSATLMAESERYSSVWQNKSISFAPNYPDTIDIQTVLLNRQSTQGVLTDLPYARREAEYVSKITHGLLFENNAARESVFRAESGKFDIIHLAMHTVLSDKDPLHSTLIFSPEKDSVNDGYLKTYEIYGIPLKAKMVVLSSCNTGTGLLSSGEGILSLARGFIFSGSQSVVMSMWEIEDQSGTEIVKLFYDNLKKGYTKSDALRKSRIYYLKHSDQLRSHPYFWSALVIYGNNNPLYFSIYLKIAAGIVLILVAGGIIYYFFRPKYS